MRRCLLTLFVLFAGIGIHAADFDKEDALKRKDAILKLFESEFVTLSPGARKFPASFIMGSGKEGTDSERPARKVSLRGPFAIAKYEVTQELFFVIMGSNPSKWTGRRNSVDRVTWPEAVEFCDKVTVELRKRKLIGANEEIRLPSEAEWEYACRSGTSTAYSFGDKVEELTHYAWFTGNAKGNDPPVGAKKPNPWGLYDMHGYIWEWCADAWHPDYKDAPADVGPRQAKDARYRVLRGGSWRDAHDKCRSAHRHSSLANERSDAIGFRCVRAQLAGPDAKTDWPQLLGPNRDGVSSETGLLSSWPKEGPPRLWEQDVAEGYSGPVIAGKRLILFHRVADKEVVECLDSSNGKPLWKFPYPSTYEDEYRKGDGPRSTPVIAGGRVFTLGAAGRLHCLDLQTGKKVWERSLQTEFKVPRSFFGVGTSPLVEGDLLLVNVGAKDAGIVAFDKDTGKEVWRATSDGASYSSPVAATIDGARHAIFLTRAGVVVLDPKDGKARFQTPWRARIDASVNAATPLVVGDLAFFSASYDTGALLLRLRKDGADKVWSEDEVLSNHYTTSVHHAGYLYGCDGRQEAGARLRCVELKTGKVQWTQERFGCGSMILAEGKLIVLTEKGDLVLIDATPKGYRELARAPVFVNLPCRAQIALAHGKLYARDGKKLVCWNLTK
jgi:outer membrane protein assembly factor BamB